MNILKEIFPFITIPASLMPTINLLAGLSVILILIIINDKLLQKLTKNRLSLEKIVRVGLVEVNKSLQLREEIQPLKINRKIKKFFHTHSAAQWRMDAEFFLHF
ncbi:hypothetical protein KTH71_06590 [Acinetobacter sp. WU_MDCI_Axc73]|nr:hypothetical protein [Acinetobacter sp. WU_MDCI_Axc73]